MFVELPKERYKETIPLYNNARFINAARSHLERTPIEKTVFVDNLDSPKTAALIVKHRTFLGGDSTNSAFNIALRDFFFSERRELLEVQDLYELDFYFSSDDWIEALTSTFPYSFAYPRYYYEIKELKEKDWREKILKGYTIEPVDLSLLEKKHLENYEWLIEEIEENWLPFEEHLKETRGFYIVYNLKEIVAWCTVEYLTVDNHIEVGIATRNEHRKKGLATIVGSATAELNLSKYETVGWHCGVNNIGSNKTALSIGFEKVKDYWKVACFFNKFDNFIVQGYNNYLGKNYTEAIKFYGLVIDAHSAGAEDVKTSAFLTKWGFTIDKLVMECASFYAAYGKKETCLENIQKAIDLGYNNLETFEEEVNFKFIKNESKWDLFIEAIQKNKED